MSVILLSCSYFTGLFLSEYKISVQLLGSIVWLMTDGYNSVDVYRKLHMTRINNKVGGTTLKVRFVATPRIHLRVFFLDKIMTCGSSWMKLFEPSAVKWNVSFLYSTLHPVTKYNRVYNRLRLCGRFALRSRYLSQGLNYLPALILFCHCPERLTVWCGIWKPCY